ncbi:hypothetical protein [Janthinobacterium sp. UMAB-56]|nr:hypothetical protein [Janthinobacterium sp. UMAB-56]
MNNVENIFFMLCYAHFRNDVQSCGAYFFDWPDIRRAGQGVVFASDA